MNRLLVFIFAAAFKIQLLHCEITRNVADECGNGKGCVFRPKNCTPVTKCDYFMSYSISGDYITIELSAAPETKSGSDYKWVAAGFSEDEEMGLDTVVYCLFSNNNAKTTVGVAYNTGKKRPQPTFINDANDNNSIVVLNESAVIDNAYICRVRRIIIPPSGTDSRIWALNKFYHLMVAGGPAENSEKWGFHGGKTHEKYPYVSGNKINVSDSLQYNQANVEAADQHCVSARSMDNLKKAHGILMLFGWWLFVASAIFFARYFKTAWPDTKIMDNLIWFNCHRGLNILGVLLIASGFICIFIAQCGVWIGDIIPRHAITGMTASICAFVQPIVAIFRCHPGTPKRPIFNWVHRIIGLGGFCCACAAIYIATYFEDMGLYYDKYGSAPSALMIFYMISLALIAVASESLITLSERVESTTQYISKPLWNILRIVLLAIFAIIAFVVVLTLSCFIDINGGK